MTKTWAVLIVSTWVLLLVDWFIVDAPFASTVLSGIAVVTGLAAIAATDVVRLWWKRARS